MRDPRDALADFFFGLKTFRIVMGLMIVGAVAASLAGCNPQQPATSPAAGAAPQIITAVVGGSRTFRVRHPSGSEVIYTIITQPETGCEYIQASDHSLTPNVGRTRHGAYMHLGCQLGSSE